MSRLNCVYRNEEISPNADIFSAMLQMKSIRALPAMENSLDNAIDRTKLKVVTDDLRNDDEHHK